MSHKLNKKQFFGVQPKNKNLKNDPKQDQNQFFFLAKMDP